MYKTRVQLKQEAKQALAGKWGTAIGMTVIISLTSVIFTVQTSEYSAISFSSLIGTLLSIIFTVGFYSFLLKICCGQKEQAAFKDIFYGFHCHPGKALLLYLLTVLYMLPGTIIYAVAITAFVFAALAGSGYALTTDFVMNNGLSMAPATLTIFVLVFLALTIAFVVYACYISLTYGLVYFLLLDYPDLPVSEIWKRSKDLMKGHRGRMLMLEFSFFGWIFLCALTLGIGILWLEPYMLATKTEFYLDLVQNQAANQRPGTAPHMDCDVEHVDLQEANGRNYTGIDPETFK